MRRPTTTHTLTTLLAGVALVATPAVLRPSPAGAVGEVCNGQAATRVVTNVDEGTVQGTPGPDVIVVTAGGSAITIEGLAGDDSICTLGRNTTIAGGDGNDYLSAETSTLSSDLAGGPGNDTLIGGSDIDTLDGGPGNDDLHGGDGRDRMLEGSAQPGDDVVDGGPDLDSIDFSSLSHGVTLDLMDNAFSGIGNDTFTGVEAWYGTRFADTMVGTDGPETLVGAAGDNDLQGNGGDDWLSSQGGRVHGGGGEDLLQIYGEARAAAGAGDDQVYIGMNIGPKAPYTSPIVAGGGPGNDFFTIDSKKMDPKAGSGIAEVRGGAGDNSVFAFIDYSHHTPIFDLGRGWLFRDRLKVARLNSIDSVQGTAGSDVIIGGPEADVLLGEKGRDRLEGHGGNDTLLGGLAHDTAIGGAGTDTCKAEVRRSCEAG